MFRLLPPVLTLAALLATATACGDDAADTAGSATAALTAPADGARLAGAVDLTMSAAGVTIVPAGDVAPNSGHFHVIADHGCITTGETIGKDADRVHFGSGAATGTIYLEPGRHSLCLQVGDGAHTALAITDTVEIEVAITSRDEWCDVVADADSLLSSVEVSSDPFPVRQIALEGVRRLIAQLEAGLDHVDADARDAVAEFIGFGALFAETMLAAESEEAGAEQLWGPDGILPEHTEHGDAGTTWIRSTCGVSLD